MDNYSLSLYTYIYIYIYIIFTHIQRDRYTYRRLEAPPVLGLHARDLLGGARPRLGQLRPQGGLFLLMFLFLLFDDCFVFMCLYLCFYLYSYLYSI